MNLKACLLITILFVTCTSMVFAADTWKLEYGSENGKVAFFNANNTKKFAEDQPYGPMSLRVLPDHLWVLDSIGSRLYAFDKNNKLKKHIEIQGLPENLLLEDFALVIGSNGEPEAAWIAEAAECKLYKISLKNGKILVKAGGHGKEQGKILQVNQLEVDRSGRLYVGDIGRGVISVFTPYGEFIREIPWQRSGFALNNSSQLFNLNYEDSAGYFLEIYSPKGQLISSSHLGFAELANARLWAVTSGKDIIVSFFPAGGFKGVLKLFQINRFGKLIKRLEFKPPQVMNRYLAGINGLIFLAEADFNAAPAGSFIVKTIDWGN
ncbi:MAG: hypothetical protein ACQETH_01650 [Candidatus Rifleibacteriota bacterium]